MSTKRSKWMETLIKLHDEQVGLQEQCVQDFYTWRKNRQALVAPPTLAEVDRPLLSGPASESVTSHSSFSLDGLDKTKEVDDQKRSPSSKAARKTRLKKGLDVPT